MQVVLGEPVLGQAERVGVRPHPRNGRLRGLLHHLAELAGDRQLPLAGIRRRLDEQHVAADRGVREPSRDAWIGGAPPRVAGEPAWPERRADARLVDIDRSFAALGHLSRGFAAEVGYAALESADAGLAGVLANDEPQCVV